MDQINPEAGIYNPQAGPLLLIQLLGALCPLKPKQASVERILKAQEPRTQLLNGLESHEPVINVARRAKSVMGNPSVPHARPPKGYVNSIFTDS